MYDGRTLVLFNRDNGETVNISVLHFIQTASDGTTIEFDATEWPSSSLRSMRPEGCYQVWTNDFRTLPADEPPADVCLTRLGMFGTNRTFWISDDPNATFEVLRGSDVLAVCPASRPGTFSETRCAIDVRR